MLALRKVLGRIKAIVSANVAECLKKETARFALRPKGGLPTTMILPDLLGAYSKKSF